MCIFMKRFTLSWGIALVILASSTGISKAIDLRDWGRTIDSASTRFEVLGSFGREAVIDKETQLVWERSPSTDVLEWRLALAGVPGGCYDKIVGGRKGWRAPTVEELASLVDPSRINPSLPNGHPFTNIVTTTSQGYWTSTTVPGSPSGAEAVHFQGGVVSGVDKTSLQHVWCVRGGQGLDGK